MSFVLFLFFFPERLGHDLPGQCFSRIRSKETQRLTDDMLEFWSMVVELSYVMFVVAWLFLSTMDSNRGTRLQIFQRL